MEELNLWTDLANPLLSIYGSMLFGLAAGLFLGRLLVDYFGDSDG